MPGTIETLILLATVGLLILLRFDARRFGAAEYEDEDGFSGWRVWLRRLSWYAFAFLLILAIYFLYPLPVSVLHLHMGEPRGDAFLAGLALGTVGILYAVAYGWLRFGELRLPPARRYPAGVLNSLATAFFDEAAFRGILLGLLLAANWPVEHAIAFQAVLYAMSTRLAARGRPMGLLVLSVLMGLAGGWLTVLTGGIGAAFLGHAITRLAVFIATGHAGQLRAVQEADQQALEESVEGTPAGWEVVSDRDPGARRGI